MEKVLSMDPRQTHDISAVRTTPPQPSPAGAADLAIYVSAHSAEQIARALELWTTAPWQFLNPSGGSC